MAEQQKDPLWLEINQVVEDSALVWIARHDYPEQKVRRLIDVLTDDLCKTVATKGSAIDSAKSGKQ